MPAPCKLLHELEAARQVRRSGARRSTVWQLITDEERIAARAAERERLRSAPAGGAEGPGPRSAARHDVVGSPRVATPSCKLSARAAGSGPSQCRAQTRDLKVAVELRCVAPAAGGMVRSIALPSTGAINLDHSVVMCDLS